MLWTQHKLFAHFNNKSSIKNTKVNEKFSCFYFITYEAENLKVLHLHYKHEIYSIYPLRIYFLFTHVKFSLYL